MMTTDYAPLALGFTLPLDVVHDVDMLSAHVGAMLAAMNRIAIGDPIKQDSGEYEWPGYIDGELVAFYRNQPEADAALLNTVLKDRIDVVCEGLCGF